jgi:glycosyltransferase involved in cell wall biosynthesis
LLHAVMLAAVIVSALIVACWALLAASLPRAVNRVARADASSPKRPTATTSAPPLVSVIVPARNEQALLPRCLASLEAQGYPSLDVVVVDDHSTDGTRTIAERSAPVVAAPDPPAGWAGKCWAAWQGARAARGEWLLFLDADAVLAPGCIEAALNGAADADLLTLMPRARCSSVLEGIVQPVMLMLLLWRYDPRRLNDPRDPAAAAPGSFLFFRRAAYEGIGGHAAVRGEVVEDLKLAERIKHGGLRLRVLAAPTLIETSRQLSPRELWNGWSRVAPDGTERHAGAALLGAGAVAILFVLPYVLAPAGSWLVALAALHFALVLVVRMQLRAAYGIDSRFAWLQPLGAIFATLVLLRATIPGKVRWRGRSYAT